MSVIEIPLNAAHPHVVKSQPTSKTASEQKTPLSQIHVLDLHGNLWCLLLTFLLLFYMFYNQSAGGSRVAEDSPMDNEGF